MSANPYLPDALAEWQEDDGMMPENVADLASKVVGHRIVSAERGHGESSGLIITLDNGKQVMLADSYDCCAFTELEDFVLHADKIEHVITGVATTEGYTVWHVLADYGDVLELKVDWSCGNPFYYGYGFHISVRELDAEQVAS